MAFRQEISQIFLKGHTDLTDIHRLLKAVGSFKNGVLLRNP